MSVIHELDETDPVLGHLLELLKAAPERDIRSAREGRSKFIAELDELFPVEAAPPKAGRRSAPAGGLIAGAGGLDGFLKSLLTPPRLVWAPITIGITVLLFLVFTGVATVRVAEKSLPGDALYNLKTSIEQAELAVITDPVDEATLNLKYAERRLVEANELAANGRVGDAQALVVESDARMKSAYATLLRVQETDPERAEQLRKIVLYRLQSFNGLVSNMYVNAPPTLVPVLQSVMSSVNSFVPEEEPSVPTGPANNGNSQPPAGSDGPANNANDNSNDANGAPPDCAGAACSDDPGPDGNPNSNENRAPDSGNPGQANNNGNGPENNNGNGPENNNGNGPQNNNGNGPENNNGNGPQNNNGEGQENNNGGGNDPNSGDGQEDGDDGGDDGDDGSDDGNNGGGDDDKDKDKEPKPPKETKEPKP